MEHLINRKEIAALMGTSTRELSAMARKGLLPCVPSDFIRINGKGSFSMFYPRSIILEWIEKRKVA